MKESFFQKEFSFLRTYLVSINVSQKISAGLKIYDTPFIIKNFHQNIEQEK
jgi:hypothetical protein